ncbi:uncharacterized protein LOC143373994 isoform X3 [Andrena cerasifolii]|uniref:uncharacterized protein LOC143373994 isoform X3 n=1 Tax=Andrena cerasifolii TaxID=2819439 RepID=UPI004037CB16
MKHCGIVDSTDHLPRSREILKKWRIESLQLRGTAKLAFDGIQLEKFPRLQPGRVRSDWKTRRRNTGASIRKRRSTERARRNVVGGQSAKDHEERLDAPEGASDGTPRPPPPPPSGQRMR